MILELDCGNSFIKWRVLSVRDGGVRGGGVVDSMERLLDELSCQALALRHARLVSVRSDEETQGMVDALAERFAIEASCARAEDVCAGVHNGYVEYGRLGVDRWVAILGAFRLAGGACLVIDLGTAVTSDFVAADGRHLGGFICPGMPLMRSQLRTHTRKIRYEDAEGRVALREMLPGRSTAEAVERGCSLMLRGFVQTQLELAGECLGGGFQTFLTGGDAHLLMGVLPEARVVPDLIFTGLALACPLS